MNASLNTEEPENVLPREFVQLSRPKKDGKGKYLTKKDISDTYDASLTNHMLVSVNETEELAPEDTLWQVSKSVKCFLPRLLEYLEDRIDGYLKKTQKCQIIKDNREKSSGAKTLSEHKLDEVCDALNTQLKDHDVPDLRQKVEAHQKAAEMTRTEMKNYMKCTTESTDLAVLTFDLQRTLPLPRITANIVFFLHGSCGYTTMGFMMEVRRKVTAISGWKGKLAVGHKSKNKPTVMEMKNGDFVGFACLEKKITNRKKDIEGKGSWLKTINIEFDKNKPYSLVLKTSFNSVGQEICLKIRNSSCVSSQDDVSGDNLQPLWSNGKPISAPKLSNLKSIMHLIPSDCRYSYDKLYTNGGTYVDIDGFGESLDFTLQTESIQKTEDCAF
ncbi:hypothetical protein PR048_028993 [Dryococelus australis]|uniref:Uncharacterized protein n=1 Tax=Dryococelus australis TaxID=614101 RepID=A0ABQ9GEQ5_9NEOP|nr:hypothetical protein PR048_028993 [Dryococelus australis]